MVKLHKTLEIKTNNDKMLLGLFFWINTLTIAENYVIWFSNKGAFLLCDYSRYNFINF